MVISLILVPSGSVKSRLDFGGMRQGMVTLVHFAEISWPPFMVTRRTMTSEVPVEVSVRTTELLVP